MTPNRDAIRKWVDALRSGDYAQNVGALVTGAPDGKSFAYCCLGVACDVAAKDGADVVLTRDPQGRPSGYVSIYGNKIGITTNSALPFVVRQWLGVDEADPNIGTVESTFCGDRSCTQCDKYERPVNATTANDSLHWTFGEIADAVEAKYLTDTENADG